MEEWAALACAIMVAIGRGYAWSHDESMEESLSAAWAHCQDIALDPSNFYYDSLFHRLLALVEALQTYVEGDDQVAG